MARLAIKRVYEPPTPGDGWRILVDRLWPRGLSKDQAHVAHWAKEVAPSDELRQWFGHEPQKWPVFQQRYFAELDAQAEVVRALVAELKSHPHSTLLYAAKDEAHNNAVALHAYLARHGLH